MTHQYKPPKRNGAVPFLVLEEGRNGLLIPRVCHPRAIFLGHFSSFFVLAVRCTVTDGQYSQS